MGRPAPSHEERRAAAAARRERRASVEDPAVVMEAAAAFLAVRPRSIRETRARLRHLGYPESLSDQVVERLIEMRYLDDEVFARAWVESRDRARPRGSVALRRELELKGIQKTTIDLVLQERTPPSTAAADEMDGRAEDADRHAAGRLLERRRSSLMREPDPRKRRQKAYSLLARNGFSPDICLEIVQGFAREADDEPAADV